MPKNNLLNRTIIFYLIFAFFHWVIIPILKSFYNALKPITDGGRKLIPVSTANKKNRGFEYKRIWASAFRGMDGYSHILLPGDAPSDRGQAWYAQQHAGYELDDLYQAHPAKLGQALSSRRLCIRFLPESLPRLRSNAIPLAKPLAIPGLTAYARPLKRHRHLIPADPAMSNPS